MQTREAVYLVFDANSPRSRAYKFKVVFMLLRFWRAFY